jgi:hypothetical protein
MPDGTTVNEQVNNTYVPAGERPNKTPIPISCFRDTRGFEDVCGRHDFAA